MVLMQGDEYVLVQETRGKAKSGLYNLPGGTLEPHENIIDCVTREVQEEAGVVVAPEFFVGLYQTVIGDTDNVLFFIFAGQVAQTAVFQSEEHEKIQAYSFDEIVKLNAAGELRAPSVLQSIEDVRKGIRHPLEIVRTHRTDSLASIVVAKD